jgi:ABC-type spermidine/putrescine transport system permease subunit II
MKQRRLSVSSVWMGMVLLFLYAPLVVVILNSFNAEFTLVEWGGFTTEWYGDAFGDARIRRDFRDTVLIAVSVAVLSLLIATATSIWARRAGRRSVGMMNLATYTRMTLPEIVIAIGLFLLFRKLGVELGATAIIAGHVVFCSAYATIVLQARLANLSMSLEEAAADLGAPAWRAFRRVTLPMLAPGLVVAGLLVLTLSADDVLVSLFLGGGNAETLPVLMLGLARRQVTAEVNVIGTLFMLFTVLTFALAIALAGIRNTTSGIAGSKEDS